MTEISRFWGGTTTGDATSAPYDAESEFSEVLRSLASAQAVATDKSGVFRDEDNELSVSSGAGQVTVATGRALVDGTWYKNDANEDVTIDTPAGSTRVDVIVLRKDFAAKTVRITKVAGTEGAGVPAITQSVGVTWDMPLAQVSITTGGVITLTDVRDFIPYHGDQSGEGGTNHAFSQISGFTESYRGVFVRVKAADEARVTAEDGIDDELQAPVEATEEYYFEAILFVTEGTAGLDIEVGVQGPHAANDSTKFVIMGYATDGTTYQEVIVTDVINQVEPTNFDSTTKVVRLQGSYRVGNAGGTFGIRWKPATSDASPVNVLEGSSLHLVRK